MRVVASTGPLPVPFTFVLKTPPAAPAAGGEDHRPGTVFGSALITAPVQVSGRR
ncbi:hypothetical protein [Catellatospora vulcania]|uniref:hypothetical protein n=1 Tax=Catellatospora vulcania TaxID=1460450 RepID=UPI0012D49B37|nr:hypothetical protein [Catellatospora vulcania]